MTDYEKEYNSLFYKTLIKSKFISTKEGVALPSRAMVYDKDEWGIDSPFSKSRKTKVQSCLMLMDTQLEREMELGLHYKLPPMKQGQCMINH